MWQSDVAEAICRQAHQGIPGFVPELMGLGFRVQGLGLNPSLILILPTPKVKGLGTHHWGILLYIGGCLILAGVGGG